MVGPATRFESGITGEQLVLIDLKSPKLAPIRGSISGVATRPNGDKFLTVADNWLDLINVVVTDDTRISIQGKTVSVDQLHPGSRIMNGFYDPINGIVDRIDIGRPRAVRIRGEIESVDATAASLTIRPKGGDLVRLVMSPNSEARITLPRIADPQLFDLQPGQNVRIAFYDQFTMELLSLIVN